MVKAITKIGNSQGIIFDSALLDTAHLKISAKTLEFPPEQFIKDLHPFIKALHHSDNDGCRDSNQPLQDDYWFLPWMREFKTPYHVIEVNNLSVEQIRAGSA